MKLLIVEDDPSLSSALLRLLGQWGYAAETAANAAEATGWLDRFAFDLVLLDLGLPDRDGLELCRSLRDSRRHQPLVLILTARDDRRSKLDGLEGGADDYVVKPFDPDLLRARIRALLRRATQPLQRSLRWGPLLLEPGQTEVRINQTCLQLTRKEALLLEQLLRAQGASRGKAELLHGLSDGRRETGEDNLRAHVRSLRHKLSAHGCPADLIETVYGFGYRLNPTAAS